MIGMTPSTRVFVAIAATDMRKSFDGLSALAHAIVGEDPLSGHLFVFANRARNRLKILVWDGSGLWVLAKRLEKGTFRWPTHDGDSGSGRHHATIRHDELAALLGGLDIERATRRRWHRVG